MVVIKKHFKKVVYKNHTEKHTGCLVIILIHSVILLEPSISITTTESMVKLNMKFRIPFKNNYLNFAFVNVNIKL